MRGVQLLDCTIRDGGYVLGWDQSCRYVRDIMNMCDASKIEYCEIGFVNAINQQSGWWDALTKDTVQSIIPGGMVPKVKLVAMLDYGKNTIEGLKWLEGSPIEIIRIAVRIEDVEKAMELATLLTNTTGVKCCINVMQLSTLSGADLSNVYRLVNQYKPWGIYLADSFGACLPKEVYRAIMAVNNGTVRVGFHGHNNLQLAFANSLAAVEAGATMIDCTVAGVGRGGGNLRTELAVGHWRGSYESEHAVEFYKTHMEKLFPNHRQDLNHTALATALSNAHPNYGTLNLANSYGRFLYGLKQLTDEQRKKFLRHAFDRTDDS